MNAPIIEVFMINDEHRNFLWESDEFRIRFIPNARSYLKSII